MTDENPADNPHSDDPAIERAATPEDAPVSDETPPGMLPLVEPYFGKRAFWICAIPFIIYLVGTGLGAHFETNRKTLPAHHMRGRSANLAKELEKSLNESLPADQAAKVLTRIDMPAVRTALDDETSDVTTLVQQCDKLLTDDFSDQPEGIRAAVLQLQNFVRHYFELDAMVEEGELDGIREAHEEWQREIYGAVPEPDEEDANSIFSPNKTFYPVLYSAACLLALLVVLFAMPGYLRVPFRISGLAIGVGVLGIVAWLGLWWLDKHYLGIGHMISPNARAGFNPWNEITNPTWLYAFLAIRLLGLCLVVPIAEEFFLRGFLMRYVEDPDWDQIPVGEATWRGWAGILAYAAMTHPGEIVAALAWFGLVTWLYLRTKNIWDCVVAHAVTNGLLAVFVIMTSTWELW